MAQKRLRAVTPELAPASLYVARSSFYAGREGLNVVAGQTVAAGHPLLEGRAAYFAPFTPTFGTLEQEPEQEPEPEPEPTPKPAPTPVAVTPVKAAEKPAAS